VRIGVSIGDFTWPAGPACLGSDLANVASTADQFGFDALTVMDHYFQIPLIGPPEQPMLEGYTTLAYLAAHTRRMQLNASWEIYRDKHDFR
jgi:alkanesulfonate monooxygenase SsuD/methylene tetrahydromethanopterin reductase-like flavin-dependent oxidoreductase (luciferase family)